MEHIGGDSQALANFNRLDGHLAVELSDALSEAVSL